MQIEQLMCEPDIFMRGDSVALLSLRDPKKDHVIMEKYVKSISILSAQRCDWHYTSKDQNPIITLKTMGDKSRVRQALSTLARPEQISVVEII